METVKSENKKRVLPSWMTAQVDERRVVPVRTSKKRKMEVLATAARLSSVKTVYCMNEAEMVDVALGILIEGHKQEKPWEQPSLEGTDKPEPSPACSVSPHTSSPGSSSEDEGSGKATPAPGLSASQGPGASSSVCSRSSEDKEEEDVLKYVREIFFS